MRAPFWWLKSLRHDSSDLNTKWYYRETDFGMSLGQTPQCNFLLWGYATPPAQTSLFYRYPYLSFTWVGRNNVGEESCSGTQHNELESWLVPTTLWSWVQCSNQCATVPHRDIMLTLTLGWSCESAFLMAKILRHDSSDLNTKWYYRETDFGMSF